MKGTATQALVTLAVGASLAAATAPVTASVDPGAKIGRILPVNLTLDQAFSTGFSEKTVVADCNNYDCSCLCGVRG